MGLLVAAVITLPFFLWNPRAFWRSVVVFQFLQPLREDSLSHLVWIHNTFRLAGTAGAVVCGAGRDAGAAVVAAAADAGLFRRRRRRDASRVLRVQQAGVRQLLLFRDRGALLGRGGSVSGGDERRECEPG
jgi:hypothetical protein